MLKGVAQGRFYLVSRHSQADTVRETDRMGMAAGCQRAAGWAGDKERLVCINVVRCELRIEIAILIVDLLLAH
jgi:hypothetical protein